MAKEHATWQFNVFKLIILLTICQGLIMNLLNKCVQFPAYLPTLIYYYAAS